MKFMRTIASTCDCDAIELSSDRQRKLTGRDLCTGSFGIKFSG